ncbi:BQ5605_C003g01861 [Microbotryum silenes-dioicae]|uniref:BQ5605_C003g01861 protein n=1 Tax=Microbotryum silenes-dioicae TaxID=796604 RepID=A0A2X0P2V4_9BASI|nr:BQ5605_C003g01861 [Microbotryum silenes-dioicae]
MAYEYDTKAVLLDLMKDGENKLCVECATPHPQWCSLSYGTYLCLSCSGIHRSLGVHISFVRSTSMDKFTPAQLGRMKAGGNLKWRQWIEASPEYEKGMSIPDKYNTHAAAQFRDKLLAEAEGRSWSPADTPAPVASSSSSSNQTGLRKPRTNIPIRGASPSASSDTSYNQPRSEYAASNDQPPDQRTMNETYFSRLGAANDSRPEHLPPSQGGKYAGFGSGGPAFTPSQSTSSKALPSFDDLRDDPGSALSKGWGFLGSALAQVGRTVQENVLQPTLEKAVDPNLQSQLSGFVSKAGNVLGEASRTGGGYLAAGLQTSSQYLKREVGVDVGDMGAGFVDRATGRGAGQGYVQVGGHQAPEGTEDHEADFFNEHMGSFASPSITSANHNAYGANSRNESSSFGDEQGQDSWAKMAPSATAARSGGAVSAGSNGGGRNSPALAVPVVTGSRGLTRTPSPRGGASAATKPVAAAAPKKKDDDWDEW